jgi:hypothetical protein
MGLFSKGTKARGEANSGEGLDPFMAVLTTVATQDNPVLFLSLVITQLLEHGVVAAEDFEKLGITIDELDGLRRSLQESESAEELDEALSVRAAIRRYDRAIESIAADRGIIVGSASHRELRTVLASFAADNGLVDLRVAYRLMLAECPERIPRPDSRGSSVTE